MRHVGLFRRKAPLVERKIDLFKEFLIDIMERASRLKAEAARIPTKRHLAENSLSELDPVANDAEFTRLIVKEPVKISRNDLVDVQEERGSLQVNKARFVHEELHIDVGPAMLRVSIEILHLRRSRRKIGYVDPLDQSRRIVGHADEAERSLEMRLHAAVDAVHILGRVERTPLQGQNINPIIHVIHSRLVVI